MRHLAPFGAAVAAAALLATGCGGATNVLQGKSPQQIVHLASSQITSTSLRMKLDGTIHIDASGVRGIPADQLQQLAGSLQNVAITGNADVQNAKRVRMTVNLPSVPGTSLVLVLYDGSFYVSKDSGKTFADAGDLGLGGLPVTPGDLSSALSYTDSVKDLGPTVRNGQRVEHLQGILGPDYLDKVMAKMGAGSGLMQRVFQVAKDAIAVQGGTLDAYVRTEDGRLDEMDTDARFALDMGRMMAALMRSFGGQLPGGNGVPAVSGLARMSESLTATFSDYGAKITVSKPAVDPNAPGLGPMFGGSTGG